MLSLLQKSQLQLISSSSQLDQNFPLDQPKAVGYMDLSLERITSALRLLGDPHSKFEVIHVAGTNGKGSVCAFLSSALQHCGVKTGRFVSPYLVHPADAICIDGERVKATEWDAAIAVPQSVGLSSFEKWTVAAFLIFAAHGVEIAIVSMI